ncbi:MAG: PAS domain S-box protein, partial [Planctomycetaceae bacterium]|nr:PAS domain S-box protein [Planctomycetaceae bacterium]
MSELKTTELLEEVKTLRQRVAKLEQQQANASCRKKHDLAQLYFDLAGEVILALDANQTISLINQQGCRLLEAEEHEIIGKNWFEHFLPPSNQVEVKALFRQLMQGELQPVEFFENDVLTAKGRLKSVAWHNSILRDNTGRIIGTLSVGVDISERKEAQQVLRENVQIFRQISENVNEMLWVCAPDFSKTYFLSPMYEEIWGRSCQSVYDDPNSWIEGIHPDDRAAVVNDLEKKARGDFTSPDFPRCRVIHTDGTMRWIETRAFPVYNEHNQITRIAGIVEDITQRKQEEDAASIMQQKLERSVETQTSELARKRAQLEAMFNAIPDAMLVLDREGKIVNFNSREKLSFFLAPDPRVGSEIESLLPGDTGNQIRLLINRVYDTRQIETFEYNLINRSGENWYRARVLPYLSDEILMMIEKISDQKIAEIELKRLHEKLSEAQRLAHIGSWEWNVKDNTLWWSDEVYRIFGVGKEAFIPNYETFLETVHPDDRR